MSRLIFLKLIHPSAKILVRHFEDLRNRVYFELGDCNIWYCKAANEIIIDTNE